MPVERDATAGEYWRSEYLGLAKLLTQAVSSGRAVIERDATASEFKCLAGRVRSHVTALYHVGCQR